MFERKQNLVADKFRQYLLPTILMAMSVSIALVLDSIIVGNLLGSRELAAVNLVTPLTLCFSAVFAMVGVGGATLMCIALGGRDLARARRILSQSNILLILASLVFPVIGLFFLPQLTSVLTSEADLAPLVSGYAGVLLLGAPLLIVVPGFTFFIRSDGNPGFASKILIYSNVVNLVMDVVNIRLFGMDIKGAALATLIGYLVGAGMIMYYLLRKEHQLRFAPLKEVRREEFVEIPAAGITSALGQIFLFLKMLAVNHIVLSTLGTPGMVAFSVCLSCLSLVSMFISGATQTMMPIVGVMFGEKDWRGIRFTVLPAIRLVTIANLGLVLIFVCFPRQILNVYGVVDQEVVKVGVEALRVFAPSLLGVGFSFLMMYYNQAVGRKGFSVVISIVQGLGVVPIAYLLAPLWGGFGIWISFSISEGVTAALIFAVSVYVRRRYAGLYESIFLFQLTRNASVSDVTIFSNVADAVGLSREISDFALERGVDKKTALMVGLAAEEMTLLILTNAYQNREKQPIDVMTRVDDAEILFRFRDGGIPFNPTECEDDEREACTNIFLLRRLAKKIEYVRVIGLNSTIITLSK